MHPEAKKRELTRIRVSRLRALDKVMVMSNSSLHLLAVPSTSSGLNVSNKRRIVHTNDSLSKRYKDDFDAEGLQDNNKHDSEASVALNDNNEQDTEASEGLQDNNKQDSEASEGLQDNDKHYSEASEGLQDNNEQDSEDSEGLKNINEQESEASERLQDNDEQVSEASEGHRDSNEQDSEGLQSTDGQISDTLDSDRQDCDEVDSDGQDRDKVDRDEQDNEGSRASDGNIGDLEGSDFDISEGSGLDDGHACAGSGVSDEEDVNAELDDITELRKWAVESQIPHTHLDSLLKILKRRVLPRLPKCSKTFLKTYTATDEIVELKGPTGDKIGEFVYFGIAHHLRRCVNINLHPNPVLDLVFNVDGLPLFKSSRQQFWPILCKIHFYPDVYKVFPVAVYTGTEKPSNVNDYFAQFVEEISEILQDGIEISGRLFEVCIKNFVCDRPARSFIKCVKNHGGYYACERCTVRGERFEKRTVYVSANCEERTDTSFRNQKQSDHHTGISPLISIPQLDMVTDFVLDFMHLCCLGVMKKLLIDYWMDGNRGVKMSQSNKLRLSQVLIHLQCQIPQDFQRTTRSLLDLNKWKATEFRFFLLYIGPVVLKNILPADLFKHFLLLHAACRILSSDDLALKFHAQAKAYLRKFVLLCSKYYGTQSHVLNMHSLIHIADDVKNMECSLSKLTAFPFESALGKMKKLLRSGNRPLSQLTRRLHEDFFATEEVPTMPRAISILSTKRVEPGEITNIKKLRYKEVVLTCKSPDNTVLVESGVILHIDSLYVRSNENENDVKISGILVKPEKPIFTYPCNSELLKMWKVAKTRTRKTFAIQKIVSKMVLLEIDDSLGEKKTYVMPLLHQTTNNN